MFRKLFVSVLGIAVKKHVVEGLRVFNRSKEILHLPGQPSKMNDTAPKQNTTIEVASAVTGAHAVYFYVNEMGKACCQSAYNKMKFTKLESKDRKMEIGKSEAYKRVTMSEMKSRIVAEAVFCHFGFEPKGRKNEWLSILKALTMQRKINFEDAILEWATMSGEYRNRQWIAAHKDGTLNEDNGFEILSLFGSDPGQIYFPEYDAVLEYRPSVDVLIANFADVLHMSDNKKGREIGQR